MCTCICSSAAMKIIHSHLSCAHSRATTATPRLVVKWADKYCRKKNMGDWNGHFWLISRRQQVRWCTQVVLEFVRKDKKAWITITQMRTVSLFALLPEVLATIW
uniref:Uncharacterized protein n=1 Tax=Schistocephalus solidus TaxID=70667 RepID=A0A0X3PZN5_SCHSO